MGIIGAGLDSRAWRLPWPQGVRLYEVDTGACSGQETAPQAREGSSGGRSLSVWAAHTLVIARRALCVPAGSVEGLKSHTFAHLPLRVAERHALVADLNDTQLLEQVLCGARACACCLRGGRCPTSRRGSEDQH